MKYAVIQNGYACFGVGDTIKDAIADAREWIGDPKCLDSIDLYVPGRTNDSEMCIARCTDRFADEVRQHGGMLSWEEKTDPHSSLTRLIDLPDD